MYYTLDLNTGLTQVLSDGTTTYTLRQAQGGAYGLGRIAQDRIPDIGFPNIHEETYFLGDALGSVRQMVTTSDGKITFAQSYDPGVYPELCRRGTVTSTHGTATTAYGFTGEQYSAETQMLYLRARYYNPADGRFTSRDTWGGDVKRPLSMNRWGYGYDNPVKYTDSSGLMPTIYGIEVDDKFSEDEKTLILETLSEFAHLLGGDEALKRNLALTEIKQDWAVFNSTGAWNAQYDEVGTIRLQPGWYSPVMVQAPNGTNLIILTPLVLKIYWIFQRDRYQQLKLALNLYLPMKWRTHSNLVIPMHFVASQIMLIYLGIFSLVLTQIRSSGEMVSGDSKIGRRSLGRSSQM